MAKVQYYNVHHKVSATRGLPAPKRNIEDLSNWYKAAKKVIPEIPQLMTEAHVMTYNEGYFLIHQHVDENWIKFEISNHKAERAWVIIDRKAPYIGN